MGSQLSPQHFRPSSTGPADTTQRGYSSHSSSVSAFARSTTRPEHRCQSSACAPSRRHGPRCDPARPPSRNASECRIQATRTRAVPSTGSVSIHGVSLTMD